MKFDCINNKSINEIEETDSDNYIIDLFEDVGSLWFSYHNTENYSITRDNIKDKCFKYGIGWVYTVVDKEWLLEQISYMLKDDNQYIDLFNKITKHASKEFCICFMP